MLAIQALDIDEFLCPETAKTGKMFPIVLFIAG